MVVSKQVPVLLMQRLGLALMLTLSPLCFAEPVTDSVADDVTPQEVVARELSTSSISTSLNKPQQAYSPELDRLLSQLAADKLMGKTGTIINTAMSFLGVPYRFGGNGPHDGGFDCSGFVRAVFASATGKALPRTAAAQASATRNINKDELQPGDLVFFTTVQRAFNHVGIYLGDNKFVHAPRTGGVVRVESLNTRYWTAHFTGARRVEVAAR